MDSILSKATRLRSIILNFGEQRSIARALFESDVPRLARLVITRGGEVENCGLRLIQGEGYTVMELKRGGVPVAVAGLAMTSTAGEILADELVQHHVRMLRAVGRSVPDNLPQFAPESLPWIQISLSPSYVDQASAMDLHWTLSVLWTAAFACLDDHRRQLQAATGP